MQFFYKNFVLLYFLIFNFHYYVLGGGLQESQCQFKNFTICQPNEACKIRDFLISVKNNSAMTKEKNTEDLSEKRHIHNKWLFCGNHKTMAFKMAEEIAHEADVELISVDVDGSERDLEIIYEAANKADTLLQQKKTVIFVIHDIDKSNQFISSTLRHYSLHRFQNPNIMIILTANKISTLRRKGMLEDLMSYFKVYWPNLTINERTKIFKSSNPESSDISAKFFAFLTWNFSENDLKQLIEKYKSQELQKCNFPFLDSYWYTIIDNNHLLMSYICDSAKLMTYSAMIFFLYLHRGKITKLILDNFNKIFAKETNASKEISK